MLGRHVGINRNYICNILRVRSLWHGCSSQKQIFRDFQLFGRLRGQWLSGTKEHKGNSPTNAFTNKIWPSGIIHVVTIPIAYCNWATSIGLINKLALSNSSNKYVHPTNHHKEVIGGPPVPVSSSTVPIFRGEGCHGLHGFHHVLSWKTAMTNIRDTLL
jgi:hypothetical protein